MKIFPKSVTAIDGVIGVIDPDADDVDLDVLLENLLYLEADERLRHALQGISMWRMKMVVSYLGPFGGRLTTGGGIGEHGGVGKLEALKCQLTTEDSPEDNSSTDEEI
ncbi:Protein of unknown function [Cotesia congregata]|uniref:Uncharacterized protein n=1 Tax=Cotesia congregata TaxID=51543 RepID=A0A8J2MQ70_COTCN|nr:Protein of unknown function [Cotesia congregata]